MSETTKSVSIEPYGSRGHVQIFDDNYKVIISTKIPPSRSVSRESSLQIVIKKYKRLKPAGIEETGTLSLYRSQATRSKIVTLMKPEAMDLIEAVWSVVDAIKNNSQIPYTSTN